MGCDYSHFRNSINLSMKGVQMIMNCDICGEDKLCKEYLCKIGNREDYMILCNDCVKIQQREGEVKEKKNE